MKLEFRLLIVDDQPDEINDAVELLKMELNDKGFSLLVSIAVDLSVVGIDTLCQASGKNLDLVIVDYRLGAHDMNGALAAKTLRRRLKYTDIIFYSTSPKDELAKQLAAVDVDGVFLSDRDHLDDVLIGVAETIIGKAVDLNHMRGIAMAEVAEMDLLMDTIIEKAFTSQNVAMVSKGRERIKKMLDNEKVQLQKLEKLVAAENVFDIVTDSSLFGSTYKYQAVSRLVDLLPQKPIDQIKIFCDYEADILKNRNILAHARATELLDGKTVSLKSIKKGQDDIIIDEKWMIDFRSKLMIQRDALTIICAAISEHADR